MSGKEAINSPAAGLGTPLKLCDWLVLMLNLASLQAAAAATIKAGNNRITETSSPLSCWA